MSIQDKAFSLATKVIKVISLKNVAVWVLAAFITIAGYTVFENRAKLVQYVVSESNSTDAPSASGFTVSAASQLKVKQLVDADELVSSAVIMSADIRNNRRIPLYWYSEDLSISKVLDSYFAERYGGVPLFTSEEKNNENIVGVINGEFACSMYADGNSSTFPGLVKRIPYICRVSIPPYYGQFSGYISLALTRIPTQDELITLKSEALTISTEIYFRDVIPVTRKAR